MNTIRVTLLTTTAIAILAASGSPVPAADKKVAGKSETPPANAAVSETPKAAAADPAAPATKKTETAIFAGGCFWCTEFAFEQVKGIVNVESGYCGGTKATANYEDVHHGTTGHAEAIRITYDPAKVTYDELLNAFFESHNPTQLNRQGEDVGKQYRSAIFYTNDEQQKQAKAKIEDLEAKHVYKRHIVTKLEPLKEFFPAEDYHQNFARRNPNVPYIQGHAVPKALQLRAKYPELIRKDD